VTDVMADTSGGELAAAIGSAVPELGPAVEILGLEPQQGNGFSSETWFCTARSPSRTEDLVLKFAPEGEGVFPSYDLEQECRILQALRREGFPVPRAWSYSLPSGESFRRDMLVMERVSGVSATDVPVYTSTGWLLEMDVAAQRHSYVATLELLATLHRIDWRRHDLGGLRQWGGPGDDGGSEFAYYRRYAEWVSPPSEIDVLARAERWLGERLPAPGEQVLSWGDAKLSNVLFDDRREPVAVLDWEMAFLGPPEADLGFWLVYDRWASEGLGFPRVPGFPGREETIALYEGFSGRRARDVEYFEVWAAYRLVLIQIRLDHLLRRRTGGGPRRTVFGPGVEILDRLVRGEDEA
jgi:aminoglycoside phosphotransferase (APT) family kinase protein